MAQWLLVAVGSAWMVASAVAQGQRPIQWISNVEQGVARAQKVGLPVMFYVSGSSRGDGGDLKDAQQRAFRDGLVGGIARERFVCIRLAQSTTTQKLLEEMGAPTRLGYCLVFATPEGKLIGMIPPGQVADARVLARQMTAMFRKYRSGVFERDIKPKLENNATRAGEIIKGLKLIEKLLILEADDSVVKLLERGGLSQTVEKQAYNVLAVLSTPKSSKALLEAGVESKLAARALARCTPGAAEELLPALASENQDEFLIAYEAVTKICKIRGTKPKGFWSGKNQQLLADEIERVTNEVRKAAKRWRERYEEYR
jgi:hypothetical protein